LAPKDKETSKKEKERGERSSLFSQIFHSKGKRKENKKISFSSKYFEQIRTGKWSVGASLLVVPLTANPYTQESLSLFQSHRQMLLYLLWARHE
jgi:hypothetical protein